MKQFRWFGFVGFLSLFLWSATWMGCKKAKTPTKKKTAIRVVKKVDKVKKNPVVKKTTDAEWIARGKKVTQSAFKTLSSNLMKAMKKGGVAKAIPFCAAKAGPISKKIAASFKVKLARVSHKPRNPKNKASAKELALLMAYADQLKAKTPLKPVIRKMGKKEVVFYAPIVLAMPPCLRCHGVPRKNIKRKDLKLIKKHYPKDKATGFRMGEIRGLWKVTFSNKS